MKKTKSSESYPRPRILELEEEILRLRAAHAEQLQNFETLDVINKIIIEATDPDKMFDQVLQQFLNIFSCDRAWLLYPCDSNAATYRIPMEKTVPQWPGAAVEGIDIPVDNYSREVFELLENTPGPVKFDAEENTLDKSATFYKEYNIRSQLLMAVHPSMGEPWALGIHHCEAPIVYSENECKLFELLGNRLADGLSNLLSWRNSKNIFDNAEIPIWIEDISDVRFTLEELRKEGVKDLRRYLEGNQQFAEDLLAMVKVTQVNEAALTLFGANTEDEFRQASSCAFGLNAMPLFLDEICAIWKKEQVFRSEVTIRTLDGKEASAIFSYKIPQTADGFRSIPVSMIDITEIKHAEEALQVSRSRYKQAEEMAQIGHWVWDKVKDKCIYCSEEHARIFGLTVDEYLKRNTSTIQDIEWAHPEDRERLKKANEEALKNKSGFETEYRIIRADGEIRHVHEIATILNDENGKVLQMAGILQDITERKLADEALATSEEKFRSIYQSTNAVAVITFDGNHCITTWNPGAEQAFGYGENETLNHSLLLLISQRYREKYKGEILRLDESNEHQMSSKMVDLYGLHKDGHEFPFEMSLGVWHSGVEKYFSAIIIDITERRNAEIQLLHSSKMATIGELTAGITHEIAQPLNIIQMSAEMALMNMDDGIKGAEFSNEIFKRIAGQATRMSDIITHMRLFAHEQDAELVPFDPVHSIFGAIGMIGPQLASHDICLIENIPDESQLVFGTELQLEQVISNLLINAKDAILGKVNIKSRVSPVGTIIINLAYEQDIESIRISISDDGGGIPENEIEKLFDPFFTTKERGKGTGLGLSISNGIISDNGGKISAENIPGGSCFNILLPVHQHEEYPDDKAVDPQPPRTMAHPERSLRILVVDDEVLATQSMATFLENIGHDVGTSFNGTEALEYVRKYPVDVVITDLIMPGMGGEQLMKTLQGEYPELPVVIITALTLTSNEKGRLASHAKAIIKKPIKLSDLTATLNELKNSRYLT